MIPTLVWGTGNVGRASIRAVDAHPDLELAAVLVRDPAKSGRDAGQLAGLDRTLGVTATDDVDAALAARPRAVVYAASGDLRPDDALADVLRLLRAGAVVVTPSLYALYDPVGAPAEIRDPVLAAIEEGGGALFVSGVDPGWGNDVLPLLVSGLAGTVETVRCQEIFDYTTYDQPDSVRYLVGMGQPMDYAPPMLAAGVPTMVWGGQVRLLARALGVELDDLRETLERRPLEYAVRTELMGEFAAGTQGAVRFEVQGIVDGEPRLVIEHVTRIHPDCAPDWPSPPDGGAGAHRVIVTGMPRIEVTVAADDEHGNRSAGGNATAAGRLVNAIDWLVEAGPGLYDALTVPLRPALGKLGRTPGEQGRKQ
ncbi:dihydrodipicolinate reductase [Nocardia farcinica]|uniref:NAD(P)H-dependent amine dehydrogenase family protein n=1 Tax=Nocardia farcinica TaxID=37329 RepID=UPI0018947FE5|nr:dihydrodipicolinate reductase [Nocardia farcinica]MBF6139849.1 dihydrodipicolinate reductase [Nocardia farcinica]MBF6256049.1 dihydrodipicolinate reductase [Nocardia farcinica]MBF6267226.1 dihydrodipicolinate reductase [Nocardia farcinica]MBF6290650.1 dihydrodipicolinate reductase [Nocardia farcinica]MBF6371571.1 dihydrodipicolinate reductase [Nocardia farcinica]